MENVIACYGDTLLQILGGLCAVTVWLQLFTSNGVLREAFVRYLLGICG